jgi:hypothetical protein
MVAARTENPRTIAERAVNAIFNQCWKLGGRRPDFEPPRRENGSLGPGGLNLPGAFILSSSPRFRETSEGFLEAHDGDVLCQLDHATCGPFPQYRVIRLIENCGQISLDFVAADAKAEVSLLTNPIPQHAADFKEFLGHRLPMRVETGLRTRDKNKRILSAPKRRW